jgi:RHS repeat-associated protein
MGGHQRPARLRQPNGSYPDTLPIPDAAPPNGVIDVFADDLDVDASANIRTSVTGSAPNRQFTVEWNNVALFRDHSKRLSAEVILPESGADIIVNYSGIDANSDEQGGNALVGIEGPGGALATQYAYHQSTLASGTAVTLHPTTTAPLTLVSAGTPVSFTFTASGVADVASYQYGVDTNPPASTVNAPALGASATVSITPDSDGIHTLYVRTVDRAGNVSPTTSYILNVGLGGLTGPKTGDISAGKTALSVATSPVTYGVTYQWRRADTDSWATIPTGDVSIAAGGGPVVGWPLARTGGVFPKLTWNLDTTLNNAEAGPDPLDGPLQVRAVFTGGLGGASSPVKITYDRNQATAATADLGPGSVNLLTGNTTLGHTDVSVASYGSDLTVTRSFNTRRAAATDPAGMFGPGWVSGVVVEAADAPYTDLTVTGSLVQVGLPDGDTLGFTTHAVTGTGRTYDSETGFEQLNLTYTTAGDFYTLKDLDGNTVTFTHITGAATGVYNPTAVTTPGSGQTTSTSWQKITVAGVDVVRPTQVLAPVPAGVSCASLVRGCRALTISYATTTTATGTSQAQWGDYLGRVTQVAFTAWDPDATPPAMRTVVMARYSYDSGGRLRAQWDPRLDWADTSTTPPTTRHLAETYDYDTDGIITTLTPAGGFQPWTLTYTTIPGDPGKGRLAQVTRSALDAGTAHTTIVYKIPLSGPGAPYDMSATQTTRWGQPEQPVDATAVFDPGQIPDGNQATGTLPTSYTRANLTYLDANGRTVNTVAPGGYTTATWYDMYGNLIRELTAGNLKRALDASTTDTATQEAAMAARESTVNTYSTDGLELRDVLGPERDTVLPDGTLVRGRTHTVNAYDQGAPTGGPYHLVTTTTTSAQYTGAGGALVDGDARTTTTSYDWILREETISTVDPAGLALTTRTAYDTTTGLTNSTTAPAGGTTTNTPATRQVVYYRAGTGSGYTECDSHPEWANRGCRAQPGGQAATGPELPVTVTTYDIYNEPRTVTHKTSAGILRTTTTSYDPAGRQSTVTVTGAAGTGSPVPTTRTTYDQASGLATHTQSLDSGGAVTAEIVRAYDSLGRITSYTDADGNTSTTTYDLLSRIATANDTQASRTYTYDGGNERRSLLTQVVDSQAGTIGGSDDADGNLVGQTWGNGITVATGYDETGAQRSISYLQSGCGQSDCTLYSETVHQSAHGQRRDGASTLSSQRYSYDNAGRLTTVNDTVNGACTTRVYTLNSATDRTGQTSYSAASDGSCQTSTGAATTAWTYDTADRVSTAGYAYDSLGRTTTTPAADTSNAGGDNLVTTYHVTDLVRSLSQGGRTTTYALDVDTSRIRSRTDTDGTTTIAKTNHYSDDTDNPVWTIEGTSEVIRPISGVDNLVAIDSSVAGVVWQIANIHGDLVAGITGSGPGLAFAGDYTESGQPHNPVDVGSRRYGWLGDSQRASDAPSGAALMGVRLYNPTTSRFLQVDPVAGGSANAYDYCAADPVNCTDLDGKRYVHRYRSTRIHYSRHHSYQRPRRKCWVCGWLTTLFAEWVVTSFITVVCVAMIMLGIVSGGDIFLLLCGLVAMVGASAVGSARE